MLKVLSFMLIVAASAMYQVASERTAPDMNPFAGIVIIYIAGLLTSLIVFFLSARGVPLFEEMKKANIFSVVLGVVVCMVDLGYIMAYRSGFSVGTLSPLSSVALMVVMALIAVIFYKERMPIRSIVGLTIAAIGVLMTIQ